MLCPYLNVPDIDQRKKLFYGLYDLGFRRHGTKNVAIAWEYHLHHDSSNRCHVTGDRGFSLGITLNKPRLVNSGSKTTLPTDVYTQVNSVQHFLHYARRFAKEYGTLVEDNPIPDQVWNTNVVGSTYLSPKLMPTEEVKLDDPSISLNTKKIGLDVLESYLDEAYLQEMRNEPSPWA